MQARCGPELPPFISIVRQPSRPVILGMDKIQPKAIMSIRVGDSCYQFHANTRLGPLQNANTILGHPSMEAFFGHPREPLSGYWCLLVACQWLVSGLFMAY